MTNLNPMIGSWYQETSQGFLFEVVAFDEEEETVEVQHLEGEVEEYDLDSWTELHLRPVAPPEDWRTAYELSVEDSRGADETFHPEDWSGALSHIEPDEVGTEDDIWAD